MIRWGFLGAGWMATVFAPAVYEAQGALLQAAAARDPERARGLGPVTTHASYDEVLADPDVDAVYISLSNEAHLPWTLASLAAGKHVLCEKPLCLTADEVDQVIAAATTRRAVEASWYRWHPRIRLAQQQLDRIGTVRHVSAGFTFAGELDGNYRMDPARGGGALYDVGHYAVSAALWAVGRGLPSDVAARARRSASGVDLSTEAVLEWDGATAEIRAGIDEGLGQWLTITGDQGELELRDAPFTTWTGTESELMVSGGSGTERLRVPPANAYRVMVEEVSSVLEGGPGWALPLEESRLTAACLDLIRNACGD